MKKKYGVVFVLSFLVSTFSFAEQTILLDLSQKSTTPAHNNGLGASVCHEKGGMVEGGVAYFGDLFGLLGTIKQGAQPVYRTIKPNMSMLIGGVKELTGKYHFQYNCGGMFDSTTFEEYRFISVPPNGHVTVSMVVECPPPGGKNPPIVTFFRIS
jgi:hypothetical protein